MKTKKEIGLLNLVIFITGCTILPPVENRVTDFDFKKGLYQIKVTQKGSATVQDVWKVRANELCPGGYTSFDQVSTDIQGGGFQEGGPGLLGYAINETIKERGQMVVVYILCNGSEITVEQARAILWGTS